MLKYFYITNDPQVASVADTAGVDRIFVDLEYIGKELRQPMDTVKNHHTVEDVRRVREAVKNAELLVRINPLDENSETEIEQVLAAGADVIMLPMWNTAGDVKRFCSMVGGRAKCLPLLETDSAADCIDEVLALDEIAEIHIGLNDLSISQKKPFLFELLTDGTVDALAGKIKRAGKRFGVGGVGAVGNRIALPAENIFAEHYRLGSEMVILSRAFCKREEFDTFEKFKSEFNRRYTANRAFEARLAGEPPEYFEQKHRETKEIIGKIKR